MALVICQKKLVQMAMRLVDPRMAGEVLERFDEKAYRG